MLRVPIHENCGGYSTEWSALQIRLYSEGVHAKCRICQQPVNWFPIVLEQDPCAIICHCGLLTKCLIARMSQTKYHACPRKKNKDSICCKFFRWCDEKKEENLEIIHSKIN